MEWEATHEYCRSNDVETCRVCGATYQVYVPEQKGHMEREEYYCPECGAEYRVWASNSPTVTFLTPRTDGKESKHKSKQSA